MSPIPTEVTEGPEDRFHLPSNLCSLRPRPILLTGIIRNLLGAHFADPRNIEEPTLRKFLWNDSVAGSKAANPVSNILIESSLQYVADVTDMRPALIIKRNEWQPMYVGLRNNELMGGNITGIQTYVAFTQGSHTVFCIAPGAAVELLASEVYREFYQFAPKLREMPHFVRVQLGGMGAASPLSKSLKEYVVPITLNYVFEDTYDLLPHAPVLKRLQVNYDTTCPSD